VATPSIFDFEAISRGVAELREPASDGHVLLLAALVNDADLDRLCEIVTSHGGNVLTYIGSVALLSFRSGDAARACGDELGRLEIIF